MRYDVTMDPIDPRELEAVVSHPGAGAICTFSGIVRDNSRGQSVTHLDYEAYAEMAVPQMKKIGQEIKDRWPEARVAMAHRTGHLEIGEVSVVVSVSCPHRAEAFEACRWGIDRLKDSVPIWKKEHAADGTFWIEGQEASALTPEQRNSGRIPVPPGRYVLFAPMAPAGSPQNAFRYALVVVKQRDNVQVDIPNTCI